MPLRETRMTVTANPSTGRVILGTRPGTPPDPRRRSPLRRLPLLLALIAATVAGASLDLAFPESGWWPIAFVSVAVALWTLRGRSLPAAFLVSLVFAVSFYLTHLVWVSQFLGPMPWVALAGLESVLFGAGGVLIALAYRWTARLRPGPRRLVAVPTLVAGLWVLRETVMGTWPYGGFPWARTGLALAGSPLAEAASWVGITGLSFLTVFVCASALEWTPWKGWPTWVPAGVVLAIMALIPQFPTEPAGTLTIGWVQGNGPSGYFDAKVPGDVLDSQAKASAPLAGREMDLLVWPEGAVDSDPLLNSESAGRLDRLVSDMGAPALVNAATTRQGETFNTSLLWTGEGATQLHDKVNPVPFGEYVPDRWFYQALAPDLIGLIQREYTSGSNPPVIDVAGTRIGLAICFDVIYDNVIHESVTAGAQLYVFQTNNADFRGTDENLQQLAIARMRAIETGRAVVNVSTTGTSQAILKDGTVLAELADDVAGAQVSELPLYTGTTLATLLMPWTGPALSWASVSALATSAFLYHRRSARKSPQYERTRL